MVSEVSEMPVVKMDFIDRTMVLAVFLLVILFMWNCFHSPPSEDAAISFRYAKNLAEGYGIVWNPGGKPVDGTTDFLFLPMVSVLVKAGLHPPVAVRLLDLIAHCLTIFLIYLVVRKQGASARWAALVSASYLGVGPALSYIWDGFATPIFGLFVGLTWWFALKLKANGNSQLDCALFGLCGLATGLERPEGVFLAGFMLLALIYFQGLQRSRSVILYFISIMGIGGGTYFLWHWHYFGYPLPNPFYIRGGGHLFLGGLRVSLKNVVELSGPFALIYLVAFCSHKTAKLAIFSLTPIVGFGSLWVMLSSEMNHNLRYQYGILPIVMLSWYPLWTEIHTLFGLPSWEDLKKRNCAPSLPVVAVLGFCLLLHRGNVWSNEGKHRADSSDDIGMMLGQFKNKHYTLATSESGLIPLYSEWRTLDTWGLNDSWIAHHGTITKSVLERENPDVIIFRCSFSPIVPPYEDPSWDFGRAWLAMVMTLKGYAESKGYSLAGAYGTDPHSTHYVYVRQDFPDSLEITRRLGVLMDDWKKDGGLIVNFADIKNQGSQ